MLYVQNRWVKVSFRLMKYPKLWLLWPRFCQSWGQNEKPGENSTQETKKGIKLVFPPKLVLKGVSPPILDLPYLCPLPSSLLTHILR
jgi:hypothetical protein